MTGKEPRYYETHTGTPLPAGWQHTMNLERAGAESTLGGVVKRLKREKKLPKYEPPSEKGWK